LLLLRHLLQGERHGRARLQRHERRHAAHGERHASGLAERRRAGRHQQRQHHQAGARPEQRHPGHRLHQRDQQVLARLDRVPEAGAGGDHRVAREQHEGARGGPGHLLGHRDERHRRRDQLGPQVDLQPRRPDRHGRGLDDLQPVGRRAHHHGVRDRQRQAHRQHPAHAHGRGRRPAGRDRQLAGDRPEVPARAADAGSLTGSAQVTIDVANVSAPVLTRTSPAEGKKFAFGAPIPFAATATDSFDGDLSARILWTSDRDGAVGTGGSFNRATLSRGTHTLTASITDAAGLSASATTHVIVLDDAPPAATISAPTRTLFADGKPITFTATAVDTIDGDRSSTITWTSNRDGAIGTGPTFTTTSLPIGGHTITAAATNSGPLTGSAQIHLNVASGPQIVVLGPPDLTVAGSGDAITFSAIAFDFEDGDLSSRLTWTSSRDGVLGTGASLTTSTLSRGVHTITVSATDADHHTASVQLAVEIIGRPTVIIATPATGALY